MEVEQMNKICGIYMITNLVNHKIYVGSSVDIKSRKSGHFGKLNRNCHQNCYLQSAWNKYREENFIFEKIEEVPERLLSERESYWINAFDSCNRHNGYNIEEICLDTPRKKVSAETKKKLAEYRGEKHWGFGKKHSKDHCFKISRAHKDKKVSEETKLKISKSKTGKCLLISPEAKAEKNKKISEALRGKICTPNIHLRKSYSLISPEGEIVNFSGVNNFCRENGLQPANVFKVLTGQRNQTKGWTKCIQKDS